jgi:hypothetical protein
MKPSLAMACCLVLAFTAMAQGTVRFDNSPVAIGNGGAPIYLSWQSRILLSGTSWVAQLYAGPTSDSLAPVGETLFFRTGTAAGFFDVSQRDAVRVIPNVAAGGMAFVQVRVWSSAFGSFEAAWEAGDAAGFSNTFAVRTGGDGIPPAMPGHLLGLQSFALMLPEPGPGVLVALVLLIFFRWHARCEAFQALVL